jgi:hypothetical protein
VRAVIIQAWRARGPAWLSRGPDPAPGSASLRRWMSTSRSRRTLDTTRCYVPAGTTVPATATRSSSTGGRTDGSGQAAFRLGLLLRRDRSRVHRTNTAYGDRADERKTLDVHGRKGMRGTPGHDHKFALARSRLRPHVRSRSQRRGMVGPVQYVGRGSGAVRMWKSRSLDAARLRGPDFAACAGHVSRLGL